MSLHRVLGLIGEAVKEDSHTVSVLGLLGAEVEGSTIIGGVDYCLLIDTA